MTKRRRLMQVWRLSADGSPMRPPPPEITVAALCGVVVGHAALDPGCTSHPRLCYSRLRHDDEGVVTAPLRAVTRECSSVLDAFGEPP